MAVAGDVSDVHQYSACTDLKMPLDSARCRISMHCLHPTPGHSAFVTHLFIQRASF